MRYSNDQYENGRLTNGFDYDHQAWVGNGKYVRCGHPESMDCGCYGRLHEGEETTQPSLLSDDSGALTLPYALIGLAAYTIYWMISHGVFQALTALQHAK